MKTVLLTGATGDIGSAILRKFENHHYHVIAPTRADLDLEIPESITEFIEKLSKPIDSYIHCAGFNEPKLLNDLTENTLQKTLQINAISFYSLCKALRKDFIANKQGSILAISSLYGDLSRKGRLAYAASKHALNGMIKTLALELGPYHVKVNAVAPGFVDTKMTRKNNSPDVIESFKKKIPLGCLAAPEDIAEVVYFLCSPQNNYINGQCIIVDGGYSVGGFQE